MRRAERGSVSVLVAVGAAGAMVVALLVLDLWRAVGARERAQGAADAAALASAGAIASGSAGSAAQVARTYAEANEAELESCRCDPEAGEAVVTVRVRFTLGLLGGERSVLATARAVIDGWAGGSSAMRGLQPWFAARLRCLFGRVGGITIVSGFRTHAQQSRLYREKPGLAAPPGHSLHELGLAADLAFATPATAARAHATAGTCGLGFEVPHEPWHAAPLGLE
jgi:secretion/DNA translocation related TadE-like protein